MSVKQEGVKTVNTQFVVKAALLGVVGFLLMMLEFPVPFVPPWLKIDVSDFTVLVAGFGLGPVGATAVAFIKTALHALLKNNDGTIVGEIAAFIIGVSMAVPASIIYRRGKTKKAMVIGLVVGGIVMTVVGAVLNAYVLIPAYSFVFGMPVDALIGIATKVNPLIKDLNTLIFVGVTPFNILKAIILAILTFLLYNKLKKYVELN